MAENRPTFSLLVAGPCVLDDLDTALRIGREVQGIAHRFGLKYVFKASFDKANRSAADAPRGPGLTDGLVMLGRIKKELGIEVLTDIHEPWQAEKVAEVADYLQIPAFLCRQTDLLTAAARTGRTVNIKKGQFMAPWDMRNVVEKVRGAGNDRVVLTERGATFGYNTLVVDFRGLAIMRSFGCPVIFDGTHSVQQPGGLGRSTGGQREFVPALCRAAVAVGVDGIFLETHPEPDCSLSDGPNMLALHEVAALIEDLVSIDRALCSGSVGRSYR